MKIKSGKDLIVSVVDENDLHVPNVVSIDTVSGECVTAVLGVNEKGKPEAQLVQSTVNWSRIELHKRAPAAT